MGVAAERLGLDRTGTVQASQRGGSVEGLILETGQAAALAGSTSRLLLGFPVAPSFPGWVSSPLLRSSGLDTGFVLRSCRPRCGMASGILGHLRTLRKVVALPGVTRSRAAAGWPDAVSRVYIGSSASQLLAMPGTLGVIGQRLAS